MANGKKAFVLYCDIRHTVQHLTDEQAGILFKHILDYVNDLNPVTNDVVIKLAFEPVKQQLKRDLKKWEQFIDKQRENGKRGGRPEKSTETQITQAFLEKPKKAVTVTVTDTVTERVNTATRREILESNLFRKANVPTKEKVWEIFMNHGGTKEMAKKFYDTHEASEWFNKNGPIKNFANLVPGYIQSWKDIKSRDNGQQKSGAAPLTKA